MSIPNNQLLYDLFVAYEDTKRNKGNTQNALRFAENYEHKLFILCNDIKSGRYKIGKSICFIVNKPVKREIFAADFRDRIVHHLIFNYINPIFEKHFIKDCYSCRKDKGTSYGIKRAERFMKSSTRDFTQKSWILKLDISGYFMSINKHILYLKIEKRLMSLQQVSFDRELVLHLIKQVIFHDPTQFCYVKGDRGDWIGLPKSKSLFFTQKDKGLPIGNLTSQLFGNIYLDEFDHFIKENLNIKYYGRYVDDMIFVHKDKNFLLKNIQKIKMYLLKTIELILHPKKIYLQTVQNGVLFLGVYLKPWRIYCATKTKHNFILALHAWNAFFEDTKNLNNSKNIEKYTASVNSYLGIMKHYNTSKLCKKIINTSRAPALWTCL